MRKIQSLFQRNYNGDRLVRDEIVPGSEWVANGEGIATRKRDGTCCLWRDGQLWKRYKLKSGEVAPDGFEPAQEPDSITGDTPGWLPVGEGKEDRWHREALGNAESSGRDLEDGTYELCGPKVQGNPEKYDKHILIRHGSEILTHCPRTFECVREYLRKRDIEGVVWHHPDGRMVKIKARDFGIRRGC